MLLEKICPSCQEPKLLVDITATGRCKDCRRIQNAELYSTTDRGRLLCYWAKQRARRKSLPYDLDDHRDDIVRRIEAGKCELSQMPFKLDTTLGFDSPSLDRVKPELGYVRSNVRVILYGWNVALGTWGESVLRQRIEEWGVLA